ncbi:uncharacterized protein [Diabrotica undecimpunctata]|uniref:uncharacterized protein n=1 Tax=Diabrotica undecimpunctata TaxID=50387 RepID=UPI003B639160
MFVTNCLSAYTPGFYVTIDEMSEAFIANKPAKYGIKIYALVDARTFFTQNLKIYPGKQPEGPYQLPNDASSVATDHYFSSIPLANSLLNDHCLTTIDHITEIDTSEDIVVFTAGFGTLIIVTQMTYLYKRWEQLFKNMLDFSVYGKPEKYDDFVKWSNRWVKYFRSYYIGGFFAYALVTIREMPLCMKINKELSFNLNCATYLPIWIPVKLPMYAQYIIFIIQFAIVIFTLLPSAMLMYLTFECVEILGLHFEHLSNHFLTIIRDKNIRYRPDGLGYWVRYHNRIISIATELSDLGKRTSSLITCVSALVVACSENQMIRGIKPLGALLFIFGWLAAILLLAHTGERLMNFTYVLREDIYSSDWYLATPSVQKDVGFILFRCQKPLYLSALPLGTINYALFVMLLKTSYSYLTLLNSSM